MNPLWKCEKDQVLEVFERLYNKSFDPLINLQRFCPLKKYRSIPWIFRPPINLSRYHPLWCCPRRRARVLYQSSIKVRYTVISPSRTSFVFKLVSKKATQDVCPPTYWFVCNITFYICLPVLLYNLRIYWFFRLRYMTSFLDANITEML